MASELALRARQILSEQQDLYSYWTSRRGGRTMPARAEIDPVAIPQLLPGLSILETSSGFESLKYRVAGTRVREICGVEVTGRRLFDLDLGTKRSYWEAVYRQILEDGIPMQGAVRNPMAGRDHILLFWLRMPLSDKDGAVNHILGYDAAVPSRLCIPNPPLTGNAA